AHSEPYTLSLHDALPIYIREAVALGDKRDFVSVMLNIDPVALGSWAERNNVTYGSYQELAAHPKVYDMLASHVDEVNRSLSEERSEEHTSELQSLRHLVC